MSAETPAPSAAEVEALAEWNRHDVIEMAACNSAEKWIQCKCGERIRVDPAAWPDETWPPTQVEEDYLTMHALTAVLSVQMAEPPARHAAEVQAARVEALRSAADAFPEPAITFPIYGANPGIAGGLRRLIRNERVTDWLRDRADGEAKA